MQVQLLISCLSIMLSLSGCASFSVPDTPPAEFMDRAEIQVSGNIEVRAAVLSEEEAEVHQPEELVEDVPMNGGQ